MSIAGFSINTLTLFGMVLAIGLLVDDAIVVVENVERLIQEEGLSPKEAARKSMDEITGALVGIALVLAAVFLPMAFFGGSTGVIYRQFSITIVSAMALSVLVALILTPALCATILKPGDPRSTRATVRSPASSAGSTAASTAPGSSTKRASDRRSAAGRRSALVYVADRRGHGVAVLAPADRLPARRGHRRRVHAGRRALRRHPAAHRQRARPGPGLFPDQGEGHVEGVFTVGGFSFAGQGQNAGIAFVPLKPWGERQGKAKRAKAIADRGDGRARRNIRDALIISFIPPAALELGNATGFDLQLVDTGNIGHAKLVEARNMMLGMAAQDKRVAGVRPVSLDDAPQLNVEVDQDKARALGLDIGQINQTISTAWGGAYINDFIDRGRVKRVYVQADEPYRHAAGGHPGPLRARAGREEHGAVHRLLDLEMGERAGPAVALQRPAVARNPGLAGARGQHGHRNEGDGGDPGQAAARHRAANGPACRTRSTSRAARRRRSTPCRCSSSSCASPRSTKAGPSRSR